jgi:hypothetical protein
LFEARIEAIFFIQACLLFSFTAFTSSIIPGHKSI